MDVPEIDHQTYIDAPIARVFQTIASAEGWNSWFTQGTTMEPREGGKLLLRWRDFGAGRWTLEDGGPILAIEKDRHLCFQWSPAGHPTTVDIQLSPLGGGTLVRLCERGYRLRADDLTALVGCAVGWGEALTLLKFYLEHGVRYGTVPQSADH